METGAESAVGSASAALTGLVWILAGLALSPVAVALVRRVAPQGARRVARWGFLHVLAVFVFGLGAMLMAGMLAGPLRHLGLSPIGASLLHTVLAMSAVCVFIAVIATRLDPDGVGSLGLRPGGHAQAAAVGWISYFLLLPAVVGLGMLWPWLMVRLGLEYEPQAVTVGILELSGLELALAAVCAVLVVPLLEEVIFRGFIQPLLVQHFGGRGGIVLTSVVFGGLHGVSAFLPIFGLSVVIGAAMLRTQRLTAPWVVHATHNGLMLALLFLVPETREMLGQER